MRPEPPPGAGDLVRYPDTPSAPQAVALRRVIPATTDGVRQALHCLADDLRACLAGRVCGEAGMPCACTGNSGGTATALCHLHDDLCARAELVLAEVFNNIVEHACAGRPAGGATGTISCEMQLASGRLCIVVRDDGQAMPDGDLPPGTLPILDVARHDLPEGGFGWHLIRSLTNGLCYLREPCCNRLSFTIPVMQSGANSR